jgi:hypothetical protein
MKEIQQTQLWISPMHIQIGAVEIAMQGAVARICHKYHHCFSSTTPYYLFGECNEEGNTMDRRSTESHSIPRTYMTEREYINVNTENMLKKQILLMDNFKEAMDITSQRIITAESCLLVLDDKRTELKNENEALKKKLAEYEAKAQAEEDPKELTLYNTNGEEITIDEWEARAVKKAKEARLEAKHHKTLPLACLTRVKRH